MRLRACPGEVHYDTIDKLCRMFHIGVGELLEYVEDEEKVSPAQENDETV